MPRDDVASKEGSPSKQPADSFQSVLNRRENAAVGGSPYEVKMQSPMDMMKGSQQVAQVSPESVRQQLERSSSKINELQSKLSQLNTSRVPEDTQKQLGKHLQQISDSLNASSLVMGTKADPLSPPKKPLKFISKTVDLLASAQGQLSQLGGMFSGNPDEVSIGKLLRIQYHLYRVQRSVELSTAIIGKTASSLNTLFNTQL